MTKYLVRATLEYIPGAEGSYEEFVDRFEDELDALNAHPNLAGSDSSCNLITCAVQVEDAASALDAVLIGTTTMRTAAHAAEASTHEWPGPDDWPDWLHQKAIEAHEITESTGQSETDPELITI
ncbi:MAG TPA: hypothetical protein VNQ77_20450 [Frankiaceae bacterium]|nr:hypothetical protein [Frankiaceae bacterium]